MELYGAVLHAAAQYKTKYSGDIQTKGKLGREKKNKSLYRQTGRHVANRETFMETKDCRLVNLYKHTEKCSNSQKNMQTDTKTGRQKERRTKRQKESKTGRKM